MNTKTIAQKLASTVQARLNCLARNNTEWEDKHTEVIAQLMRSLPSGSGIDSGTEIDLDASNGEKLVFTMDFHHMNENGYYCGWTYHKVIVTPCFDGFDVKITGRDRNGIKEYLGDTYHYALSQAAD